VTKHGLLVPEVFIQFQITTHHHNIDDAALVFMTVTTISGSDSVQMCLWFTSVRAAWQGREKCWRHNTTALTYKINYICNLYCNICYYARCEFTTAVKSDLTTSWLRSIYFDMSVITSLKNRTASIFSAEVNLKAVMFPCKTGGHLSHYEWLQETKPYAFLFDSISLNWSGLNQFKVGYTNRILSGFLCRMSTSDGNM
jgi:hypothetical protein